MSQFIYKDVPIEVEDYQEQAELATATTTGKARFLSQLAAHFCGQRTAGPLPADLLYSRSQTRTMANPEEPTQMATTETPAQTAVVEEEQEGQLPLAPSGFRIYRRFKVGGATATKSKKSGKKTNPSYEKLAVDSEFYCANC